MASTSSSSEFDFEVEVLKSLKDDPRIIEIEIAKRKQKMDDAAADCAHFREIEMRRLQTGQ